MQYFPFGLMLSSILLYPFAAILFLGVVNHVFQLFFKWLMIVVYLSPSSQMLDTDSIVNFGISLNWSSFHFSLENVFDDSTFH